MKAIRMLSKQEKRAAEAEIMSQIAERTRKMETDIDAMVILVLVEHFGFGKKRAKRFYDEFSKAMKELSDWYVMSEGDQAWLATQRLKKYGIDISEWERTSEETCTTT